MPVVVVADHAVARVAPQEAAVVVQEAHQGLAPQVLPI
jgi:hypothetical protein